MVLWGGMTRLIILENLSPGLGNRSFADTSTLPVSGLDSRATLYPYCFYLRCFGFRSFLPFFPDYWVPFEDVRNFQIGPWDHVRASVANFLVS